MAPQLHFLLEAVPFLSGLIGALLLHWTGRRIAVPTVMIGCLLFGLAWPTVTGEVAMPLAPLALILDTSGALLGWLAASALIRSRRARERAASS